MPTIQFEVSQQTMDAYARIPKSVVSDKDTGELPEAHRLAKEMFLQFVRQNTVLE